MVSYALARAVSVTVLIALPVISGKATAQRRVPSAVGMVPNAWRPISVPAAPVTIAASVRRISPTALAAQVSRPRPARAAAAEARVERGRPLWVGAAVGAAAGLGVGIGIRALVVDRASQPWYRDRQFYPAAAGFAAAGAGVGILVSSLLR